MRLAELRTLPDDWDSYGGTPPTSLALKRAELLVADLATTFGRALGDRAIPTEIFPNPDGGLELEWSSDDWTLGVEIGPTGDARYMTNIGSGPDATYTKGEIPASASAVDQLLSALR